MKRDIVVIGGSAGSSAAMREVVTSLKPDLGAAVFIVLHRALMLGSDYVPSSLTRAAGLEAVLAGDCDQFKTNRVYVAPAGRNLQIGKGVLYVLSHTATSKNESIDVLFRSAAEIYESRVIGLVMSGSLSDGTAGLREIRKRGGIAIVQDPTEAPYPSMPQNAMQSVPVDFCLRASEIAPKLHELIGGAERPLSKKGRIMIVEDDWMLRAI